MINLVDTILVPQGAEYQAVCRGISPADRQQIKIIPIPIGVDRLSEYLSGRNFWQSRPQRVLIFGLCGSLCSQYAVGDAILYRGCYSLDRKFLATDSQLTDLIYHQTRQSVSLVTGLTGDRPICQSQEKKHLADTYSTQVVDMEGYDHIKLLQSQGVAVAILRVVSDDCLGDLPDLKGAIVDGKLDSVKLAIAMLRQPLAAMRLIKGSLIGLNHLSSIVKHLSTTKA